METKWKVTLQMQFLDLEVWFCHIREQGKKKQHCFFVHMFQTLPFFQVWPMRPYHQKTANFQGFFSSNEMICQDLLQLFKMKKV